MKKVLTAFAITLGLAANVAALDIAFRVTPNMAFPS